MSNKPKGKCEWCGNRLVAVGHSRSNGADHDDWSSRKLHKQCYKEKLKEEERDRIDRVYAGLRFKAALASGRCLIDLSDSD